MKRISKYLLLLLWLQPLLHSGLVLAHQPDYVGSGVDILLATAIPDDQQRTQVNLRTIVDQVYRERREEIDQGEFEPARSEIIEAYARARLGPDFPEGQFDVNQYVESQIGFDRLTLDSIIDILRERNGDLPEDPPKDTHPLCIDAYHDKRIWHERHGGGADDNGDIAFGKIIEYSLASSDTKTWAGWVHVCSWYGVRNLYFVIELPVIDEGQLQRMSKDTAGNVLPDDRLDLGDVMADMFQSSRFKHKLHASGKGVIFREVYVNSELLAASDPFFANDENEPRCFDIFFENPPTGDQNDDLSNQSNYCMGRCDGGHINTGK